MLKFIPMVYLIFLPALLFADFEIQAEPGHSHTWPRVARQGDSTNFCVVWEYYLNSYRTIRGEIINGSGGTIVDNFAICTATLRSYLPSVAWGSTQYMCVWTDYRSDNYDIYGRPISSTGVCGPEFQISYASVHETHPWISWNNSDRHLVVWTYRYSASNFDIYGKIIDNGGATIIGPFPIAFSTAMEEHPKCVSNGSNWLVVYSEFDNIYNGDISGKLVSNTGEVGSKITICNDAAMQARPSVSSNGTDFLVVWYDRRGVGTDPDDIYGQRVSSAGGLLGSNFLIIDGPDDQQFNSVCWDGTYYYVVCDDWASRQLLGRGVDPSGGLTEQRTETNRPLGCRALFPEIAWNGNNYFIVWADLATDYSIWGNLISPVNIEETERRETERQEKILQVYPNPFNQKTNIRYQIPDTRYEITNEHISDISYLTLVSIKIYDATGRLVKSFLLPTSYFLLPTSVEWNGTDDAGRKLPPGIYFVRLETEDYKQTEKVSLLK